MKKFIEGNWFKIAVLFMVLVVVGLVAYFYNRSKVFEDEQQISKTQITLQEQCASGAKNFFNEDKWGRAADDLNSSRINYVNHYNSKYNKCFVLITERFFDGSGTSEVLYDVFGHKQYADGTFGTNDYSFKNSYCTILNGECKSTTDFNQFVSEYMES